MKPIGMRDKMRGVSTVKGHQGCPICHPTDCDSNRALEKRRVRAEILQQLEPEERTAKEKG